MWFTVVRVDNRKQLNNMKKATFFLLLTSTFCFSQNSTELKKLDEILKSQKKSLVKKKINIENQISEIDKKIEINNSKITVQNLKKRLLKLP
jgi:hypothetical protein